MAKESSNNLLIARNDSFQLEPTKPENAYHAVSMQVALEKCERHINRMNRYVHELENGLRLNGFRTSFKIALKGSKIKEFARHVEQAKTTLLMAINVTTFFLQLVSESISVSSSEVD
jgi:hypothetical protein